MSGIEDSPWFYSLAWLGLVIIFLLFFIIRDHSQYKIGDHDKKYVGFKTLWIGLKKMCCNPQMWIISIIACLAYLPASVFLDVWGLPYLVSARHLTLSQASFAISLVFLGWIVSGPLTGIFSDWIKRRQLPLIIASIGELCVITCILYGPNMSAVDIPSLLFLFGFFAGTQPLVFSLGRENNPNNLAATATAFVNMLTMVGGVVFQPIVGILIDLHRGTHSVGAHYSSSDFTYGLMILPVCLAFSLILTFFLKETYCEVEESRSNEADKEVLISSTIQDSL